MPKILPDASLDQLFRRARTFSHWLDKPVSETHIRALYEMVKLAPTSANQQPGRFVWCQSEEAKAQLAQCAGEGNKEKVLSAPVTVVIGYDIDFHLQLPWLYPHADAKSWFAGDQDGRIASAKRNSAMQAGYLILAARSLGLDCGPMSGFDADAASKIFFADEPRWRADLICSIGYGDRTKLHPRSPRPSFETFNRIA